MTVQELAERILAIIKNADGSADQHAAYAMALDDIEMLCNRVPRTGEEQLSQEQEGKP